MQSLSCAFTEWLWQAAACLQGLHDMSHALLLRQMAWSYFDVPRAVVSRLNGCPDGMSFVDLA
jgi:hypothetical protein